MGTIISILYSSAVFLDTIFECSLPTQFPGKSIWHNFLEITSAFFQKSALNSPTITTLPYVGTISWEIYLVLSHGKIYMALSHGKSIWYYLMGNLFGIISWKIYLALSHSWEYERSLPSDEYYLKI